MQSLIGICLSTFLTDDQLLFLAVGYAEVLVMLKFPRLIDFQASERWILNELVCG